VEITDHQIDQYWADGATVRRNVIAPQWREPLRRRSNEMSPVIGWTPNSVPWCMTLRDPR